jgi:hypothetical protein
MTLTDFLRARFDEDEATARAAAEVEDSPDWGVGGEPAVFAIQTPLGDPSRCEEDNNLMTPNYCDDRPLVQPDDLKQGARHLEHIARWDPARVLAEVEAKRRIVEELADVPVDDEDLGVGYSPEWWQGQRILLYLALPYADHPDYRGEWRS